MGPKAWVGVAYFGMHTWIAIKDENGAAFERFEVVGWGVSRGAEAVRRNRHAADGFWAGNPPVLLGEVRGEQAAKAITTAFGLL